MSAALGAGALVVVPTLNEIDNLPRLLPAIFAALPGAHVLVVDDHSPDGTGALADALARAEPRLFVLHRQGPPGLGPAYLAGFAWALDRDYQHIFEMDADLSHPPDLLPALLHAAERYDLVLGCRYMPGGGVSGWGLHRRLLSRLGNTYARLVLGLPLRDLTGGYKCFRRSVLAALPLDRVQTRGYAFQIELTALAWRRGFLVGELPFCFPDRAHGQSKMSLRIAGEAAVGLWKMRSDVLPSGPVGPGEVR
jgi:dolichol-phosphate mannosyltransferase